MTRRGSETALDCRARGWVEASDDTCGRNWGGRVCGEGEGEGRKATLSHCSHRACPIRMQRVQMALAHRLLTVLAPQRPRKDGGGGDAGGGGGSVGGGTAGRAEGQRATRQHRRVHGVSAEPESWWPNFFQTLTAAFICCALRTRSK